MNSMDSKHLIDYFRNKKGKYLKLNNGEKVKLPVRALETVTGTPSSCRVAASVPAPSSPTSEPVPALNLDRDAHAASKVVRKASGQ